MEDSMILFLLLVVLFGLLMGYFQVPIWIMYGVLAVALVFIVFRNPLIFGRDTQKMMAYIKKSKAPYLQFLYHFLQRDLPATEQAKEKICSKKVKVNSEVMLLMERKQYGKAKELHKQMNGHKTKWYALADIAIQEGNTNAFQQYKKKLKDIFFINMLEVDQAVFDGKKKKAVTLLDHMIPKLRGYKLLTAVQYRKQVLEGKV
jgi:hypothetical protein